MAADLLNERLPQDWSYGVMSDGRVFFINERHQETSWLHPVTGRPVQTGHQAAPGLPNGWEQDYTPEGVTYFIDHHNRQTSFGHPVTGRPVSEENPPPPPSSPPQSPSDRVEFRRGTTSSKQRSIKAPSVKRNPNAQVVRRGFLYRLESGGISKTWKRRWCVLADFALFIYKNDEEKVTLGSILLPSFRINRCTAEDHVQKEFAFKVEHENTKTIYFHTDTQTDLDSWLYNLHTAATMKGAGGFYREANNNIKAGPPPRSPAGQHSRTPQDASHHHSSNDPGLEFHPQWKNPNPSPSGQHQHQLQHQHSPGHSSQNGVSGPPSWRSVPDLERGDDGRETRRPQEAGEVPDPRGSLRSLPHDGHRYPQDFPPPPQGLQPDSRNYAHHQSYDPRLTRPRVEERDPRGSVRSLQPDPYKNAQDFVPLGQSRAAERDRGSYTQPGFQPYQRPPDPQQRSSMVSDPGWRGDPRGGQGQGQGSPQRSPRDAYHASQGSIDGAYRPRYPHEEGRNQPYPSSPGGHGGEGRTYGRERGSWQAAPQSRNSVANSDTGRRPQDPRGYPDRPLGQEPGRDDSYPDVHPRLNASLDPRASYASSRHSVASQGYRGDRDDLGSKQNLFPQQGSRNSLSRLSAPPPPPHHDPHGHTYVNVPEMRGTEQPQQQQFEESPPPERPPYPAAVRDQVVRDMAETHSPGTAEKMLMAHELNKERMQQLSYFQYPTPREEHAASRVEDAGNREAAKRLSHYSDRNSVASNSAMRNDAAAPSSFSVQPPRAPVRDYYDGGRRQDSGSSRLSDSFERRSAEGRRADDAGRGGERVREAPVPEERQFGGDPEAKSLRQAYERVQSFRQSSAAAREGMNRRPIQTVREEPDMPDNEVLETKLQKKYPLNGTRLRMSISAGDLIGKTHDELVLLLIQLRRNQAALGKARDFYRESLGKKRPMEREYRKQRHDSVGRMERSLEEGHQSFVDIRSQLEEVEKKLEVYRPLINLVDNMVTMGSLYGGDNLMLATQYRKHLLRPDQYQAPRKMLEFSRQHQEQRFVSGIQNDVRQLTAAEVDLEEKIDRLNQLERLLQEQSFKVSSFREDKELLEKALQGILRQTREAPDSLRDQQRLQQQQMAVEKELSRVTQDLAEASKALERTTVENNKIEHEVALLRTKVHGELKRSKSAPSLGTGENANTKVKMERELARVQNMLQGLSQQGEKLSQQMSTIRRSSSGTQLAAAFEEAEKSRKAGTYLQTDLDSGEQVDLAQHIPVSSSSSSAPPSASLSPTSPHIPASGGGDLPLISHQRQESTLGIPTDRDSGADWDIGDADDNTKRFYGLLPKEKPKGLTVRDVKRQSEQRRERKRDDDVQDIPLRVSSTDDDSTTFIHARYPSYASSQSSGLDLSARDPPSAPLYENLPRSGSMPALNQNGSGQGSRRSSINLMAPKPFTPYQDKTAKPFRSDLALHSTDPFTADLTADTASKAFSSQVALSSWDGSPADYTVVRTNDGVSTAAAPPLTSDPLGQVVTAHPFQLGGSADNIVDLQQTTGGGVRSSLPSYTRLPQPFRAPSFGSSPSNPELSAPLSLSSSQPTFTGVTRPVLEGGNTSRVYAPRPWAKERAEVQPGLYDVKRSPKGRFMTVSSSQPTTLEPGAYNSPSLQSALAGDLISNGRVDNVPDVVKSSLTNVDKIDQMDEDMIDREILYFPEKVSIPERYDPEADAEQLTDAQRLERQEKAERIKRILASQSVLSVSQPDVHQLAPGQLHRQAEREKEERAHILSLNQELARQVTQRSKKAAVERRKTWSGGQIADIKAQYEAEMMMSSPERFDNLSRTTRQAHVLL
ncbi:uncharacterized protein LOC143286534 [Babylonia areolata]|uniref:uncharacterized protein LOC143286534 n=1 Tax=Babylonia areolata TaxID=304850 RepID=UPI003FD45D2F